MVPSANLPTPHAAAGDSETSIAFQQARHQNNMYYALEMLKSEGDANAPSKYLGEVQKALTAVVEKFPPDKVTRLRLVQDTLALQHLYMTREEIDNHFFDNKDDLKTGLTDASPDDTAWGKLAFGLMQSSVAGYNEFKGKKLGKEDRVKGQTRDAYLKLAEHLDVIGAKGKLPPNRNDISAAIQDKGYMEDFVKKAGFTPAKIKRHEDYLDTEFFLLGDNAWWSDLNADKDRYAAHSDFRAHVVGKNPDLRRQTMMRVTSSPRRGSTSFQGTPKENTTTRRVSFKNSPFDMEELKQLINAASSPTFDADAISKKPPVSNLVGKENPFNKVVFKIFDKWYIVAAELDANGDLTLHRFEIKATGHPPKPLKDGDNYVKKAGVKSRLLTTSDLILARDEKDGKVPLTEIVEKGLEDLIKLCGYGVLANNATDGEEMDISIRAKTEEAAPVLFAMDDTALLREWLLMPELDLSTMQDAKDAIFAGVDDADIISYMAAINNARTNLDSNVGEKDYKLRDVYKFLHDKPSAAAALAKYAMQAAVNSPVANLMKVINTRNASEYAKLPEQQMAAYEAVCWGGVLARLMELAPYTKPPGTLSVAALVSELNAMIVEENKMLPADRQMKQLSSAPDKKKNYSGGIEGVLKTVTENFTLLNDQSDRVHFFQQREAIRHAVYYYVEGCKKDSEYNIDKFADELQGAEVSLAAANIIPTPVEKKYSEYDVEALRAIAWVGVMGELITALTNKPESTAADLVKVLDEAIKVQNAAMGNVITALTPAQLDTKNGMPSGTPSQVLDAVISPIKNYCASGSRTTAFVSQLEACDRIRKVCLAAGDAVVNNTQPDFSAALLAAPFSKNDFENAALYPVDMELVRRRMTKDTTAAVGWARKDNTINDERVFVAASSDATDYMSVGLMHFIKTHPTEVLSVVVDSKKFTIEPCSPPNGAIPGKMYYQVKDKDGAIYKPTREQRVDLQTALQEKLMGFAKEAMKQGAVRRDTNNVVNVTPDREDNRVAHVDGNPTVGSANIKGSNNENELLGTHIKHG